MRACSGCCLVAALALGLAACAGEPPRDADGPAETASPRVQQEGGRMSGKVCLVTGATSGIGKVTARALAEMGATVLVVSRNPTRCADTVEEIRAATENPAVEFMVADLSDLAQVRRVAADVAVRYPRLDVLVNNAGAYYLKRLESADGYEMTLALNYLSPFLLTNLLLPSLEASEAARIINVSSGAHSRGEIDFEDLQSRHEYVGFEAYAQSKLALMLFTHELARRLEGSSVTVNALHPGLVATRFGRNNGLIRFYVRRLLKRGELTPEEGARTSIYLATSPEVEGVTGSYFVAGKPAEPSASSRDPAVAARLWALSLELTDLDESPNPPAPPEE